MVPLLPLRVLQSMVTTPSAAMCDATKPFMCPTPLDDVPIDASMLQSVLYSNMCPSEPSQMIQLAFDNGVPVMLGIWILIVAGLFNNKIL